MQKITGNEGIIQSGGSINAGSLAVGRGAIARQTQAPNEDTGAALKIRLSVPAGNEALQGQEVREEYREWDVFISHASEDKARFVRPLAEVLLEKGLRVWYDDFTLTVGDSLRKSIDRGLAKSHYGVVVLSQNFFAKHWPQEELSGLITEEMDGRKVVLPVWYNVTFEQVRRFSPILADRVAAKSSEGLSAVVEKLLCAMHKPRQGDASPSRT